MSLVSGFFAYKSYEAQKAQAKYTQQAAEFQQKQVNLQNARAKRDAVREARMAYGATANAAANQGVSASSSAQGGAASIISQVTDNISFLDQYGFYSDQASKALGKASAAGAKAQGYQAAYGFVKQAENTAARLAMGGGG